MTGFSDESILLIRHWRTVEDIVAAKERLEGELTTWVYSLESLLGTLDWWNDGWRFVRYGSAQAYISNEAWHVHDRYAIWVGIEGVTSSALFGSGSAPLFYVWVNTKSTELLSALVDSLKSSDLELPGEIDVRMSNFYVARQSAMKYIDGELETYSAALREQVLNFLGFYAQWLRAIDEVIQQHL